MKHLLNIMLLFLTSAAGAQDLTGTWEGYTSNGRDYVKLVLVRAADGYVGYSYDESKGLGACTANFVGTFNSPGQRLQGGDRGVQRQRQDSAELSLNVQFEKGDGFDYLAGLFNPRGARRMEGSLSVPIKLRRVGTHTDTTQFMRRELARLQSPQPIAPTAANMALTLKETRRNELVQELEITEPEVRVLVYDNGAFDGDTVSILHNDTLIADHRAVKVAPFELSLHLEEGTVNQLTLIAHNLGSIPPNTASLTVIAGAQRYRLTASTDLTRNAVIRFRYAKR